MRLVLALSAILALSAAPAFAQDTSFAALQTAAAGGDARAQLELGDDYYTGRDVDQDYAQALSWYQKAADNGNSDAEVALAMMYTRGAGVPQDDAQALAWDQKAAAQGNMGAQYDIGVAYDNGARCDARPRHRLRLVPEVRRPGFRRRPVQSRQHVRDRRRWCRRIMPRR
ncbi:MAG: tetratricopeptide repeat protein [Asticcacaulis sp.]